MSESEWTKATGSNGATYHAQLVKQAPEPAAELEVVPVADAEHADDKSTGWGVQQPQQTFSKTAEAPAGAMDSQVEDQGIKLPVGESAARLISGQLPNSACVHVFMLQLRCTCNTVSHA
eukprot:366377-Chlamydomonas_euryale.AAC.5